MPRVDFKNWCSHQQRAIAQCWTHFKTSPFTSLITVFTIGISIALPLALFLVWKNVTLAANTWDTGTQVVVYCDPALSDKDASSLFTDLKGRPEIALAQFLSKTEALAEFTQRTSMNGALDMLPENPLPAAIILEPKASIDRFALQRFIQSVETLPGVDSVSFDWIWLQRLNAILKTLGTATILLSTLLGLGVVFVVGNTIRLILDKHREEIDVHALIGASCGFVQRPFLYRGCLYAISGAVIALLMAVAAIIALDAPVTKLASLYDTSIHLHFLNLHEGILLFLISLGLGWIGAWIAVTQQWQIVNENLMR